MCLGYSFDICEYSKGEFPMHLYLDNHIFTAGTGSEICRRFLCIFFYILVYNSVFLFLCSEEQEVKMSLKRKLGGEKSQQSPEKK